MFSGNILRNMDNPLSETTLEGRKLRAVGLLVMKQTKFDLYSLFSYD